MTIDAFSRNRTGFRPSAGFLTLLAATALAVGLVAQVARADDDDRDDFDERAFAVDPRQPGELPFKAATIIIELTDNDIELQAFVDGNNWRRLAIADPRGERVNFDLMTRRRLGRQGMSELHFASEPSDFPVDAFGEIDPDGAIDTVAAFLVRFPEGGYEMEALTRNGELAGVATLTHVLPALPEITAPIPSTDVPPVVDPNNLVIEWEPVTTQFLGDGPVDIIEYQVILDQVDPLRETPWIDGGSRRALINVPATATRLTVPPEFLLPSTHYDFEVVAIEASGNSTISVGEFTTQ